MSSSAASRLLSFSNNASLQNLIRRQLLRPSTNAPSIRQLPNPIPEPQVSDPFNAYTPNTNMSTFTFQKSSSNAAEVSMNIADAANWQSPLGMSALGVGGVDRSGISKIHTLPVDNDNADSDYEDSEDESSDDYYDHDHDDDNDYDDSALGPDSDLE